MKDQEKDKGMINHLQQSFRKNLPIQKKIKYLKQVKKNLIYVLIVKLNFVEKSLKFYMQLKALQKQKTQKIRMIH